MTMQTIVWIFGYRSRVAQTAKPITPNGPAPNILSAQLDMGSWMSMVGMVVHGNRLSDFGSGVEIFF